MKVVQILEFDIDKTLRWELEPSLRIKQNKFVQFVRITTSTNETVNWSIATNKTLRQTMVNNENYF